MTDRLISPRRSCKHHVPLLIGKREASVYPLIGPRRSRIVASTVA